jgi:Bacterial low temperature requirement A protein (LtrA)
MPASLRRARTTGGQRVTNVELFFDLVYVFAVTQLSHYLLAHLTLAGALQDGLLLVMVWALWAYTTWATNWLEPDRIPVRVLLMALMLGSLVMSAELPRAFAGGGLVVGVAYAAMQIGRSAFAAWALTGPLRRNYQRILSWCCVSGALAVAGGLAGHWAREALWLAAVLVDLAGGRVGFWTPGLGRTPTAEWDIEGGHFAERCQGFILIALGESLVVTGATLTRLLAGPLAAPHARVAPTVAAFAVAFVGILGLWWLYFDRSLPLDPPDHGRGHHRDRGRRRDRAVRPAAAGHRARGVADPGRDLPLHRRPRRVQGGGVRAAVLDPDGRAGRDGPARAGRSARHRAGPERLRGRGGDRRGGGRPARGPSRRPPRRVILVRSPSRARHAQGSVMTG